MRTFSWNEDAASKKDPEFVLCSLQKENLVVEWWQVNCENFPFAVPEKEVCRGFGK